MSDALDLRVLDLVGRLIAAHDADAMLVQRLWKDRTDLVEALILIRDWDLGHSEALSVQRVQSLVHDALLTVGEAE